MSPDLTILLLFAALALYGAYSDIRFRTIPNVFNALMAIVGLGATWFAHGIPGVGFSLAHLAVALAAGLALYALGVWGGGDAKFYAASAAWFELGDFPLLALSIALSGLIVLIVWFGGRQVRKPARRDRGKKELPYGVAIALGGIVALALRV